MKKRRALSLVLAASMILSLMPALPAAAGPSTDRATLDALAAANAGLLADGTYAIQVTAGDRLVLDVSGGSYDDGANVQHYTSNASGAQRWVVTHDAKGYIEIRNKQSGKALDVQYAAAYSGQNVWQYEPNGSYAQKWIATDNGSGLLALHSALDSDLVLGSTGDKDYSNLQLQTYTGLNTQYYDFYSADVNTTPAGKSIESGSYTIQAGPHTEDVYIEYQDARGFYTIKSMTTGELFDADMGDVVPLASVGTYGTETFGLKQRYWNIHDVGGGMYQIVNEANGQLLSVKDGLKTAPATYTCPNEWTISTSSIYWTTSELDAFAATKKASPDLNDNTYQLALSAQVDMAIDINGGSLDDSADAQIYETNETAAQRWKVMNLGNGYVAIVNKGSGKVLDVRGACDEPGTPVQQYTFNGSRAQLWIPSANGDGTFTFYSALAKNLVLDVCGGSTENYAKLTVYTNNHTAAQKFYAYPENPSISPNGMVVAEGVYTIRPNEKLDKAMDLSGGSLENGAGIQIYEANDSLAQGFQLVYGSDGYYRIVVAKTGKALDVDNGRLVPGGRIQQWDLGMDNKNQKWVIYQNTDGSYSFISAANGLALDSGAGNMGTQLRTQTPSSAASQKWKLITYKPQMKDGCYSLETVLKKGQVIDITGGSEDSGANAQIYSWNASQAQKYYLQNQTDGSITIQSIVSGKFLTDASGNLLQMDNGGTTDAARWTLSFSIGKGYVLVNRSSGRVMDVAGGNSASGTNVCTYSENGTDAQAWNINEANMIEDGTYEFVPLTNTNLRLNVQGSSDANFANIQVTSGNKSSYQKFRVKSNGDGWYTITSAGSKKVLDISEGSSADGTNVQQYESNGSNAQKWKFKMGPKGIVVESALGTVLDVVGGSDISGTNVDSYSYNGTNAQQWRMKPVDEEGWVYKGGYKLYYRNGELVTDVRSIIGKQSSYYIKINKQMSTVTIYARDGVNGPYTVPVVAFACSPGEGTPTGIFNTQNKYRWWTLYGADGQFCTRITGHILFHSPPYSAYDPYTLWPAEYNKLGTWASAGCVRLRSGDAAWIYYNCDLGTTVEIYNSSVSGPLGKPEYEKIPLSQTWDPTDPELP